MEEKKEDDDDEDNEEGTTGNHLWALGSSVSLRATLAGQSGGAKSRRAAALNPVVDTNVQNYSTYSQVAEGSCALFVVLGVGTRLKSRQPFGRQAV